MIDQALAAGWLRRVARSAHADRMILRGSLLTSQWVPGRPAADIDHVVVPSSSLDEARAMIDDILAVADREPLPPAAHEVIWADTPWPGLRMRLGDLQVDVGRGDPIALAPTRIGLLGVDVLAVRPETMFAWKVHGLIELGPGKWRPKDLYDAWLLDTRLALDEGAAVASLRLAFESREDPFSKLDRFLDDDAWGRSRGSRRKWETFRRRWTGPLPVPDLRDARDHVRARLAPLVRRP